MAKLNLRDQSGTTLVELVVATMAGTVIFLGLTMVIVASMHQQTRISKRVHATQEARTLVQRIVTELHSTCVASSVAPIQGTNTSTSISYVYQTGSGAALTPVKHKVYLSGTTLMLSTYASTSGSTPKWTFSETPASTQTLLTNVSGVSVSEPLFRYYKYKEGVITAMPSTVTEAEAPSVVQVDIALKVSPTESTVKDAKAPGIVQDSAFLRFSPPSANVNAANLPCE